MVGIKERQRVETRIVASAIADLLEAGFEITVNDGEEDVVVRSTSVTEIASAMMSTDEDYLFAHREGEARHFGWVRFIYGNDGPDVINDYTTNLEPFLTNTNELAQAEEERLFG